MEVSSIFNHFVSLAVHFDVKRPFQIKDPKIGLTASDDSIETIDDAL